MKFKIGDIVQHKDTKETFVVHGIVSQNTPVDIGRLSGYVGSGKVIAHEADVALLHGKSKDKDKGAVATAFSDSDNVVWGT